MTDEHPGDTGPIKARWLFLLAVVLAVLTLGASAVGMAWWWSVIQLSMTIGVLVWCAFGVAFLGSLGVGHLVIARQIGGTTMPLVIAIWGPLLLGCTPPGVIFTALSAYKLFRGRFPDAEWSEREMGTNYTQHSAEGAVFGRAGLPTAVMLLGVTVLLPMVWIRIFTG